MSIRWPRGCGASRRVRTSAQRHDQPLHRLFGGGDLGARHLREILPLQHFAVGHRHARVELDLALFLELVVEAGEQRLMHARRAGLRRLRRRRRLRQHHRQQLIDIAAAAEEDAKRLIEQHRVLVPLHEHRVQRPVKIVARADAGRLHRFERIEHRAGPDRNAGRAQRAGEVDDVLGEPAGAFLVSHGHTPPARLQRDASCRKRSCRVPPARRKRSRQPTRRSRTGCKTSRPRSYRMELRRDRISKFLILDIVLFGGLPRPAKVGLFLFFAAGLADGVLMPFFALWAQQDAGIPIEYIGLLLVAMPAANCWQRHSSAASPTGSAGGRCCWFRRAGVGVGLYAALPDQRCHRGCLVADRHRSI